jgi:large subunit ribosomal protein L25
MSEVISLAAQARQPSGKGGARARRRSGQIPAIIYGNKETPQAIAIDETALQKVLRGPGFFSRVFEIQIGNDKQRVLARDLQRDPLTDRPLHVDFMRFSATTRVNIDVEVNFINEDQSPGLKHGGVLNVVRHTVELICSPDRIPEGLTVDLAGLEIGDVVHVDALKIPEGAELAATERDATVATIAAPSVEELPAAEEAAEEEAAAPGSEAS